MDFPLHIDTIIMGLPIVYFKGLQVEISNYDVKGSQVEISNYDVFLSLHVVLILSNSADPDEMHHNAACNLGLHCLPEYQFRGFPVYKGLMSI